MTKLFIWVRSRLNTCCTDIFFVTNLFTRIPSRKKAKHWELLRNHAQAHIRSSHTDVFIGKDVLKICSKFTGGHSCRSVISIKLQSSFIEITLRHGCSPVNLLHIFRTSFLKNISGRLLLSHASGPKNFSQIGLFLSNWRIVFYPNIFFLIPYCT